jgi:endoglucanase
MAGEGRPARAFGVLAAITAVCAAGSFGVPPAAAGGKPAPWRAPNPFAGEQLFVDPDSRARRQIVEWQATRPADAALLERIASRPQGDWFTSVYPDIRAAVAARVGQITASGSLPVLVTYNVPKLDCDSKRGASTGEAYLAWIRAFREGIGTAKAVVIVEPDALSMLDCLSASGRAERLRLIRAAARELSEGGRIAVYLDAGHDRWQPVRVMAARLKAAGVRLVRGFSLNVANFGWTNRVRDHGKRLSSRLGGAHFLIDTGRNGLGPTPDNAWCNPPGRALGEPPRVARGRVLDALLWVKQPGESDGTCEGGPPPGVWWPEYALGLAQRAAA